MILTGRFSADGTTNVERSHPSELGPKATSPCTDFFLDLERFDGRNMLQNATF